MVKYLILSPDTFLWFNDKQGIFYNCKTQSSLLFDCNPLILKYCLLINNYSNMYSVEIDENDENDSHFCIWTGRIINYHVGKIVTLSKDDKKPFSFPPILNLRNEAEERQMDNANYRPTNIVNNFHEITFLLGGERLKEEETDYYKQIPYPINSDICLNLDSIYSFLDTTNIRKLHQVNIISNSFENYPDFKSLLETLPRYNIPITYFVKGGNANIIDFFLQHSQIENVSIELYFTDVEHLQIIENLLAPKGINYKWIFLLKKTEDLDTFQNIIELYGITKYRMVPVIIDNKSNSEFFRDYVFISQEELSELSLTKRNIFCNQVLNSNFFGKLYVTPNKKVYANLNGDALGTLEEDALYLIRKEIINEKSFWKYTREKSDPCNKCIYRALCPPPSNYEFYLNRFDLCTVKDL